MNQEGFLDVEFVLGLEVGERAGTFEDFGGDGDASVDGEGLEKPRLAGVLEVGFVEVPGVEGAFEEGLAIGVAIVGEGRPRAGVEEVASVDAFGELVGGGEGASSGVGVLASLGQDLGVEFEPLRVGESDFHPHAAG